jgi:hypothetical protein
MSTRVCRTALYSVSHALPLRLYRTKPCPSNRPHTSAVYRFVTCIPTGDRMVSNMPRCKGMPICQGD